MHLILYKNLYFWIKLRFEVLSKFKIEPHKNTISLDNDILKDDMTLSDAKVVSGSIIKVWDPKYSKDIVNN